MGPSVKQGQGSSEPRRETSTSRPRSRLAGAEGRGRGGLAVVLREEGKELGPREQGRREGGFDALVPRSASEAGQHGGRKRAHRDEGGPVGESGSPQAL